MNKERHLTQKERWQWQQANKDTLVFREEEEVALPENDGIETNEKQRHENAKYQSVVPSKPKQRHTLPPLRIGDFAGVEKRMAQRFATGQTPLNRVIDLHGLNKVEAFSHIHQQLHLAYDRGERCILVITGKGRRQESVLRSSFPQWVNDPMMRPILLAVAQAKPKDGGEGAFYVLLKKRDR